MIAVQDVGALIGLAQIVAPICANLRGRNGRHSRLKRLIGRAVPVQASLSAGLRASTITVWSRQYAMLGLSI